jgi:hypothetical protein
MIMITASDLVKREVHYCVSHLVYIVAGGYGNVESTTELSDLAEQAFELCSPIDDWEEAATQEGWRKGKNGFYFAHDFSDHDATSWQELCEAEDIEPYQRDVFEHWLVSDWLADKLAAKGEKVDKDFAGLTVWARTTTGQGIAWDWAIEQITQELGKG